MFDSLKTSFRFQNEYIYMTRGDTLAFAVELIGLDQDLDTCTFTIKKHLNDDSSAVKKSIGDGITKVETGLYSVRVAPEDTAELELGRYWYALEISANGDVYTVMKGIIELSFDVREVE